MMQTIMDLAGGTLLPIALWLVMFTMGLGLATSDFHRIVSNRKAFVLGAISMLLIVPAMGTTLAVLYGPSPALTVGLILLATTPGGILSNLLTDIAGGDVALSVSLSLFLSSIYVFTLPFIAQFALHFAYGSAPVVQIPLSSSISHILMVTLVPVSIGMVCRHFLPALSARVGPPIKTAGSTALVIVFGMIVVQQLPVLRAAFGTLMAIVVAMNIAAFIIALLVSKVGRLSHSETIAVAVEHLIRQEGTAIFIAVTLLHRNDMSIPMVINTFIGMAGCIVFVSVMRRIRPEAFPVAA